MPQVHKAEDADLLGDLASGSTVGFLVGHRCVRPGFEVPTPKQHPTFLTVESLHLLGNLTA